MGIFSNSTPFDSDVEKMTDEKNTSEDWGKIMDFCDRVQATKDGPRDCLKSIMKRLSHQDPHVVIQAITLLDAAANNCGKPFRLEIASREFETDFRKLLGNRSHQRVQEKLKGMLKGWAEGDFKGDPQLALIPSLYIQLKKEGIDFSSSGAGASSNSSGKSTSSASKNPNVVSAQQEEDDIAKAIQLSLQESKSSPSQQAMSALSKTTKSGSSNQSQSSLYPSANAPMDLNSFLASTSGSVLPTSSSSSNSTPKEEKKGRAIYDFEAAEDNELTFKAGEIVIIIDDSDANWWKGTNHRGVGLFPANFVTTDLDEEPAQFKEEKQKQQRRRSVQFSEEVEVKTLDDDTTAIAQQPAVVLEISENKIDQVMSMLNEADPTLPESDPIELEPLEEQVNGMGPLIDTELELVDRRHAQLTRISTELVDALNLYHQLMHEGQAMQQHQGYNLGMPIQHQMATPNPTQMYSHIYQGATPTVSSNAVPPISGGMAMSPQHQQQLYQQNTSQQQMPPMQGVTPAVAYSNSFSTQQPGIGTHVQPPINGALSEQQHPAMRAGSAPLSHQEPTQQQSGPPSAIQQPYYVTAGSAPPSIVGQGRSQSPNLRTPQNQQTPYPQGVPQQQIDPHFTHTQGAQQLPQSEPTFIANGGHPPTSGSYPGVSIPPIQAHGLAPQALPPMN